MIRQLDFFDTGIIKKWISDDHMEQFSEMYFSGLSTWRCYGNDDAMLCVHVSKDSPEFFIVGEYGVDLSPILDYITEQLEPRGYVRYLRRQDCDQEDTFAQQVSSRYEYATDYIVPAKLKCLFSKHWYILYDSTLAEKDTAVNAAVLKKEYRSNPNVGNI